MIPTGQISRICRSLFRRLGLYPAFPLTKAALRIALTVCIALLVAFILSKEYTRGRIEPIPNFTIGLLPLEPFDPEVLDQAEAALSEAFSCAVTRLPPRPLPKEAYYAKRNRYRADLILKAIDSEAPAQLTNVLAVTSVDISRPTWRGDWGVMGLGTKRVAVFSPFRLNLDSPSEERFKMRVRKVAVHELAHTLGLRHCPETRCVMHSAEGTVKQVDREGVGFCTVCKQLVGMATGRCKVTLPDGRLTDNSYRLSVIGIR